MDILDGSFDESWINSGEGFAADFLVIGASKVPRELDSGLFYGWLDILHLDILDGDGEGLESEAEGLG